jgi:transposase
MSWRQNNNQWSGGIAAHPAPKNFEYKNPLENFSPRFFGIRMASSSFIIFLRAKLSQRSIIQLKDILKEKRLGKVTNSVLFLHDNAPAHRERTTQKLLAHQGFLSLDRPPYSPDLAPSEYHLFSGLKKQMTVHHFASDAEVIAAAEIWLNVQFSEFLLSGLQRVEQRTTKCLELRW